MYAGRDALPSEQIRKAHSQPVTNRKGVHMKQYTASSVISYPKMVQLLVMISLANLNSVFILTIFHGKIFTKLYQCNGCSLVGEH